MRSVKRVAASAGGGHAAAAAPAGGVGRRAGIGAAGQVPSGGAGRAARGSSEFLRLFRPVGRGIVAGLEGLTKHSIPIAGVGAMLAAGGLALGLGSAVTVVGAGLLIAGFSVLPGRLAWECEQPGPAEKPVQLTPAWAASVPTVTVTGPEFTELQRQWTEFRTIFRREGYTIGGRAPLMLSAGQLDAAQTIAGHRVLTLCGASGEGDRLIVLGPALNIEHPDGPISDIQLIHEIEPRLRGTTIAYTASTRVLFRLDGARLGTADAMLVESDLAHCLGGVAYHYGLPVAMADGAGAQVALQ
ncbi:MAG: hypothetical protein HY696_10470 [Deltaproteobacteria bacterium]|nr:hypothetical protein [Deltaproteobacteria bacterium]